MFKVNAAARLKATQVKASQKFTLKIEDAEDIDLSDLEDAMSPHATIPTGWSGNDTVEVESKISKPELIKYLAQVDIKAK
jgi:hypothetical protein